MELRDFFTEKEIQDMRERIIKETISYAFLDSIDEKDGDGPYTIKQLNKQVKKAVQDETDRLVKDYVKEVVDTIARDQITKAVESFTTKLLERLNKIADKTNWY